MVRIISFDIGLKNLSYCFLEDEKIVGWDNVDISHKDQVRQAEKIWDLLQTITPNSLLQEWMPEIVVEKQMAARMKRIESYILMYYIDKKRLGMVTNVTLFHAKYKLKHYTRQVGDLEMGTKKYSTRYANNKYKGKEQCRIIIHREGMQEQEWLQKYKSSKKKDDLADSFLQGRAYYLMKHKGKK